MNWKYPITLCLIVLFIYSSKAQKTDTKPCKLGITFSSFGENDVVRFKELIGSASYDSDKFFTIGINYIRPLNNCLDLETGIEYSKQNIIVNAGVYPGANTPRKADFSLINIPVSLRANFLRLFFVNAGLVLDIDAETSSPIDNQTGIGGLFGIGIYHDFNCGASIFVNPYMKAHSLIQFSSEKYPQRLMESGTRIGLMYNF